MLGRTVEGYQIVELIEHRHRHGHGGIHYAVRHAERGAAVLRLLPLAPGEPAAPVLATARRLQQLTDRNLERVLGTGQIEPEGTPFTLCEVLGGETLAERLADPARGPLPVRAALALLAQATAGLSALHQAGVAHRHLSAHGLRLIADGVSPAAKLVELLPQATLFGEAAARRAEELQGDLQALGLLFCDMLGLRDLVLPGRFSTAARGGGGRVYPPAFAEDLRHALQPPEARSATEMFARLEAAARRAGLLHPDDPGRAGAGTLLDSKATVRTSRPPLSPGLPGLVPAAPGLADVSLTVPLPRTDAEPAPPAPPEPPEEEEAATIEVERMDPGELLPFLAQAQKSLVNLVGPLEDEARTQRTPRAAGKAEPRAGAAEDESGAEDLRAAEPRRARTGSSTEPVTRTRTLNWILSGPGAWLLPLGLCTLLTLALAAWVLWGHR